MGRGTGLQIPGDPYMAQYRREREAAEREKKEKEEKKKEKEAKSEQNLQAMVQHTLRLKEINKISSSSSSSSGAKKETKEEAKEDTTEDTKEEAKAQAKQVPKAEASPTTKKGPLCEENIGDIRFNIKDMTLPTDATHSGAKEEALEKAKEETKEETKKGPLCEENMRDTRFNIMDDIPAQQVLKRMRPSPWLLLQITLRPDFDPRKRWYEYL